MSFGHPGLPAAVLWDMDGTLVDTEPYWMACEHELVAAHGGVWTDADARAIVGFDLLDAAEYLRARAGLALDARTIVDTLVDGVTERVRQRIPWRPGARALLTALRQQQVPCALVTMSWEPLARMIVDGVGPGLFQAVVTGDHVTNGKPDPEPYALAAARLGVDPIDCVAIEDSPTGARSAFDAGCVVLGVPNHVVIPADVTHRQIATLVDVTPEDLGALLAAVPPPARAAAAAPRSPRPGRPDGAGRAGHGDRPAAARAGDAARRRLGVLAGASALLVAAVVWFVAGRGGDDPGADREPGPLVVHTWVPYWALEEAQSEIDQRADVLHEVSPFWFSATGVEDIGPDANAPEEATATFVEAAREAGIPLVASILDATEPGTMAGILADHDQRATHVDAIRAFAADGEWDGIDIDYERFAFDDGRDTWATTRPNWVSFISALADALHADGRTLTVSIPPVYDAGQTSDSGFWVYDYGAITPHVDAIRVMAYDYSVAGSDPGPIAPLAWVEQIIAGTTEASGDPSKLILGVPLYGRNWPVAATGECPESAPGVETVTNRAVDELVTRRGATPVYDAAFGEWTFSYSAEFADAGTSCTQERTVFYVDDDGIQQRVQLAVDAGFGGVALFAFGYDDPEVWSAIAAINANLRPAAAGE